MCRLPYTAGLPPSSRERVSKFHYYAPRFHCAPVRQTGSEAVFIAPAHAIVAPLLKPLAVSSLAGSVLAVKCIKLWELSKMYLCYIGSENAIFTTSSQIFFDFAQSLRHRLLREPEHIGCLRLGADVNAEKREKLQVSLRQLAQLCIEP